MTPLRNTFEIPELVSEILDAVDHETKALRDQEFGADVGQLVLRRDVVDGDGAVVHKLPYVKEAKSDMFGPGAERLVADDVESGRVVGNRDGPRG